MILSDTCAAEELTSTALAVFESCHSTWLFDEVNHRFRRLLKGMQLTSPVSTEWRSYDHVVLDEGSDTFLVYLDRSGTRLLRSSRHLANSCERCGEGTSMLSGPSEPTVGRSQIPRLSSDPERG